MTYSTFFKITFNQIVILFPWALLFWQLGVVWETNKQYSHGFVVPLLMIYLIGKLPSQNSPSDSNTKSTLQKKLIYFLGIPLIFSFFPLWIIRGANPDWRLLNLVLYMVVCTLTLIQIHHRGGIQQFKKFLFPLLFCLVAIPWPLATDLKLTQWLQQKVSSTIVDLLLLMEHEAILQGTVIDVGVFGQIGVDQACSGINGLQASAVVTLFLGAYFGLPLAQRVALFASGIVIALAMNLTRAFTMSFIKVKGKGALLDSPLFSIGAWQTPNLHDLAGWIETFGIFLAILLIGKVLCMGTVHKPIGNQFFSWKNFSFHPPKGFSIFSALTLTGTVFASEAHFRNGESNMIDVPKLNLSLLDENILKIPQDIPRQVAAQLHFSDASSSKWQDLFRTIPHPYGLEPQMNPNEQYWQAFEAHWDSGGACTAVLSTHSPDSCIPLTGLTQVNPVPGQDATLVSVKVADQKVFFETYEFARNYRKLFVFRCFWSKKLEPGQPNVFPSGGYNFNGRIQSAIDGRRNVGGTMLVLAIANVDSNLSAISKLRALANQRLSLGFNGID